jgi:hypothetical protein
MQASLAGESIVVPLMMSLARICLLAGIKGQATRAGSADESRPGLGQVQLAFDITQNLIIDPALIAAVYRS